MDVGDMSSGTSGSDYQVFLSFSGSDTRQGFVDTLYHCLIDEGIRVFKDDVDQPLGEKIERILDAIDGSAICIPVFSRGYASSKWCLRELTRMVEKNKKIIPVFYDVAPDDVKLKTGLYADALMDHRHKVKRTESEARGDSASEVKQWEEALRKVGAITGRELRDTGHGEFSKSITKEVLLKLKVKQMHLPDHLVGMDDRVEALLELLDTEAPDVRYVGIHGMGGIGKTTLAKVVFNELSCHFDGCSFLSDIRESSRRDGIKYLQKQLLTDLGCKLEDVSDSDYGIKKIKSVAWNKKVLLVLDDVDQSDQIEGLAGNCSWFAMGSRIIVTTRDIAVLAMGEEALKGGVLKQSREVKAFEMEEMDSVQALKLFSKHAFGNDFPPPHCLDLSKEAVSVTGHLPLCLEIIGSYLGRRCKEEWKAKIKALREVPHKDVQQKLMVSYDALSFREKQMFLDIATLFINEEKTNAIDMWEACNFHPEMGLVELVSKSLLKITEGNRFWMHDLLRDLGREIIRQENFANPGERSRLWIHEVALRVLERREGSKKVEAMRLSLDKRLKDHFFGPREFKHLKNLRFLEMCGLSVAGDFDHLFPNLRWLSWHYCPSDFKITNLNLQNLVILDLSWSCIDEKWGGWSQIEMGNNLKVLDLTGCQKLTRTPIFSSYKMLERLILENCMNLTEIDPSIGQLKNLKHLNIEGCNSLQGLPAQLGSLAALEEVFMRGNGGSFSIPESIGDLKSMTFLELSGVHIADDVPVSLCKLKKLKHLSLSQCSGIQRLDEAFGDLQSLVELDISGSKISELPDSIGHLKELKVIRMRGSQISKLPDTFGLLEKLEELHAGLTRLDGVFPRQAAEGLSCLRVLDLSSTRIQALPSISKLNFLQTLDLEECHMLQELPELPASLISLKISSHSLQRLPDLSGLNNLTNLELSNMTYGEFKRRQSPFIEKFTAHSEPHHLDSIQKLSKLVSLELTLVKFTYIPTDFRGLSQLKELELACPDMELPLQLPHGLSSLALRHLEVGKNFPRLSHLNNLSYLALDDCLIKDGAESLGIGDLGLLTTCSIRRFEIDELTEHCLPQNLRDLRVYTCGLLKKLDLRRVKNLTQLHLLNCLEVTEIPGLGGLRDLEILEIMGCHSLERLENLKELEKLDSFELADCPSLVDVEGDTEQCLPQNLRALVVYKCGLLKKLDLRRVKNLTKLQLRGCLELTEIPGLGGARDLRFLEIMGCHSLERLENLKELEKLEGFRLEDCPSLVDVEGDTEQCLPQNLRVLRVYKCGLLKKLDLRRVKNLTWLHLQDCLEVTEIPGLGGLRDLEFLEIRGCHWLERLENLKELEKLEAFGLEDCPSLVDVEGDTDGGIRYAQRMAIERSLNREKKKRFSFNTSLDIQ